MSAARLELVPVAMLDRRLGHLRLASPGEISRLRSSIERDGVCMPIVVSDGIERDKRVVIDGHKRVRILLEMEIETVMAQLVSLDAPAAEVAMLTLNVPHRGLSSLEEAWIVHSLCRTHGMQQIKVAELIGHDVSWVCRRMKLAESLVPELQEDVQLGLLSPTCAREVARLPRGKQAETGQAIREHGLTSRQATQLAQVLLRTDDPCAQREVLHDPLRYVTALPSATKSAGDPSLSVEANKIRLCLLAWEETSGRLVRSLQRYAPRGVGNDDARALAPLCGTALRAGHGAADCLAQALDDSNLRSDRDG